MMNPALQYWHIRLSVSMCTMHGYGLRILLAFRARTIARAPRTRRKTFHHTNAFPNFILGFLQHMRQGCVKGCSNFFRDNPLER